MLRRRRTAANPSDELLVEGRPISWGDVDAMFGSSTLTEAVRGLAPLSGEEVDAVFCTFQLLARGRSPMLPQTEEDRALTRGEHISLLAVDEATELALRDREAGEPVVRGALSMLLELVCSLGNPDHLEDRSGWLWGPAGPPVESPGVAPMSIEATWKAHAQAVGATWTQALAQDFEKATKTKYQNLVQENVVILASMRDLSAIVMGNAYKINQLREDAQGLLQMGGGLDASDQKALAEWSAQAWELADQIRDYAAGAMKAYLCVAIESALVQTTGVETRARTVLNAMGWAEGVVDWWLRNAPYNPTNNSQSYWAITDPSPEEYWIAAFTASRLEIGYARGGVDGMARVLINRNALLNADQKELVQAGLAGTEAGTVLGV